MRGREGERIKKRKQYRGNVGRWYHSPPTAKIFSKQMKHGEKDRGGLFNATPMAEAAMTKLNGIGVGTSRWVLH